MPIRLTHTPTRCWVMAPPAFVTTTLSTQRKLENVPGRIHISHIFGTFPRSYSQPALPFGVLLGNSQQNEHAWVVNFFLRVQDIARCLLALKQGCILN